MSWIIGTLGSASTVLTEKVKSISPRPLYECVENNFLIKTGGNQETCVYPKADDTHNHFIAVGLGIKMNHNKLNVMSSQNWEMIHNVEQTRELNGHFILVKWNKNEIEIFSDKLGLRDIYFIKLPDNVILFSTRVDWIAGIVQSKINYREFGSRWLLFNQLSSGCVFENIQRITAGSNARINRADSSININKFNWLPDKARNGLSFKEYSDILEKLITFPSLNSKRISLGLSGGMDSRVMLSYLAKNNKLNWHSYTFGDESSPDSLIVKNIISDNEIINEQINLPFSTADDCVAGISDYVSRTLVNNAASGFLQLRNYDALIGRDDIIIDGGFGEIWRREFFNRLRVRGRASLKNNDIKGILNYLITPRADIFNSEIKRSMLKGAEEQLNNKLNELPSVNEIGLENWVDLFAIKTRLINYYSYEQARLDELILNYMPFVQPMLLENLMNINLMQRKNGRLFRKIIKTNQKHLIRYPLAKGSFSHPYWFNTIQSRIWDILRKKIKWKIYHDHNQRHLLNLLTPFIQDIIHSQRTKESDYYDYSKIIKLSAILTRKNASYKDISELDWWLAFELFHQRLNGY